MHNFKEGDRVVFEIGKSTEDHGVVTDIKDYPKIWCKWDSDYRISYTVAEDLTLERANKFKVGDRVVYKIGTDKQDHGVVICVEFCGTIWVRLDNKELDWEVEKSTLTLENLTQERNHKMNATTLEDLEAKYASLGAEIQKLKEEDKAKESWPQREDWSKWFSQGK